MPLTARRARQALEPIARSVRSAARHDSGHDVFFTLSRALLREGLDDGFLRDTRHLILDRDPLYTSAFRQLLKDSGCKIVRLPPRSPDLNGYAERFVLSIKSECLSRMVPLGEEHLRRAVREYVAHYHSERHHQGLGNRLIAPANTDAVVGTGPVRRRERLGGLLNFYYREAA